MATRKPVSNSLENLVEIAADYQGEGEREERYQNNTTLPIALSEPGPGYGNEEVMGRAVAQSVMTNDIIDSTTKNAYKDLLKSAMGKHTRPSITYVDNKKVTLDSEVRDVPNTLESEEQGLITARKILKALIGIDMFNEARMRARGRGFKTQVGTKTATWLSQLLALELERAETMRMPKEGLEAFREGVDNRDDSVVVKAVRLVFGQKTADKLRQLAYLHQVSTREVILYLVHKILAKQAEIIHAVPYDIDSDESENSEANK